MNGKNALQHWGMSVQPGRRHGPVSIRGGIVDIFPLTEEVPVRIELWDDEVDSIRSFDPESQRSVEQLKNYHYPQPRPF